MVGSMPEPSPSPFNCPACGAEYKVVRMEATSAETSHEEVQCRNCGGPLDARDGAFILKYFLVGTPKKSRRKK
jgi:transcription elongation factor Elf1